MKKTQSWRRKKMVQGKRAEKKKKGGGEPNGVYGAK